MSVVLKRIDAVEFAVHSIPQSEKLLSLWGFKKLGQGKNKHASQALWGQGQIRIVLSQGNDEQSYASKFVKKHGDGICNVTFQVDSAKDTYETVVKRGAPSHTEPFSENGKVGKFHYAAIKAMGDVVHTFINREGAQTFSAALEVPLETVSTGGVGLFEVDHLTCNLGVGELEKWASFYEKVFEFKETRFFHITTGRTGLISKVMENKEGTVKIPLNEPTDKKSQIQEYIDVNHGPGIQHLALATKDILQTLPQLRKAGQDFLDVPDTYYEEVPARVKGIKEDLNQLKTHRILADGDSSGYLLQIFSQNVVGPFFYEVIKRCGNRGFGEGNFKALFQAIERDQEKRGVL